MALSWTLERVAVGVRYMEKHYRRLVHIELCILESSRIFSVLWWNLLRLHYSVGEALWKGLVKLYKYYRTGRWSLILLLQWGFPLSEAHFPCFKMWESSTAFTREWMNNLEVFGFQWRIVLSPACFVFVPVLLLLTHSWDRSPARRCFCFEKAKG